MEAKTDKFGWVEKRSAYLKQWRMRWLVLANCCLCTYKTQNTAETPTERIPLDSILAVSQQIGETPRPYCFQINTRSRLYVLSVSQAETALDWMRTIQGALQLLDTPSNQLIERQKQSQQTLASIFSSLQCILTEREGCLLSELEVSHAHTLAQAREELLAFNAAAKDVESSFETFKEIEGNKEMDLIQKLRLANALSKDCGLFWGIDLLVDSRTSFFAPPKSRISDLMTSCLSISLENPLECRARRTSITRALKWRYDGERVDAITLSVSREVLLTGIGFCRPCKANGRILTKMLRVLQGANTAGTVVYSHSLQSVVEADARDSVQKIALNPPVMLRSKLTYTIAMKMEGSASYKCVDCSRTMTSEGEANWTFTTTVFSPTDLSNRTDASCGPIADFYYMLVGDR